jgi:hypothetical protein
VKRYLAGAAFLAAMATSCSVFSGGPEVVCGDPQPENVAAGLTCDAAVEAAMDVLPADHADILRIVFYAGTPCPNGAECPMTPPDVGSVVFETTNPVWWDIAWVDAEASGAVTAEYGGPVRAGFPND